MIAEGSVLNQRYVLAHRVGRGGFAEVYEATDQSLQRRVAVKILLPQLSEDPAFLAGFAREAQQVARLEHPHILPVYDYGQIEDTAYLVMPYVDGGTLRQRLRAGPRLTLDETGDLLRQAAAALDYAHGLNVVHRDVKPDNMLLHHGGRHLLLADFGIAKVLSASSVQSLSRSVGTIAYMAPEQFRGQISRAVDIYALGCVLYQMLTGDAPYGGTSEQVMYDHFYTPVPDIRARGDLPIAPVVAPAIQAVLERALAKDRDARYPSAGDLSAAFDAAVRAHAAATANAPADAPLDQAPTFVVSPPPATAAPMMAPPATVAPPPSGAGPAAPLAPSGQGWAAPVSAQGLAAAPPAQGWQQPAPAAPGQNWAQPAPAPLPSTTPGVATPPLAAPVGQSVAPPRAAGVPPGGGQAPGGYGPAYVAPPPKKGGGKGFLIGCLVALLLVIGGGTALTIWLIGRASSAVTSARHALETPAAAAANDLAATATAALAEPTSPADAGAAGAPTAVAGGVGGAVANNPAFGVTPTPVPEYKVTIPEQSLSTSFQVNDKNPDRGALHVLGEVVNSGQTALTVAAVKIEVLDAAGATIATGETTTGFYSPYLRPGAKGLWEIHMDNVPKTWKGIRARAEGGPPSERDRTVLYFDLKPEEVSVAPPDPRAGGYGTITGKVHNTGTGTVEQVQVTYGVYDGAGKLVAIATDSTQTIGPGETSTFKAYYSAAQAPGRTEAFLVGYKKGQ
ncbi:MAG TPA: protein kinase [Thermomicrobiales bacterium]|nr:protein kinase [Thermomicrobiales bacterium]